MRSPRRRSQPPPCPPPLPYFFGPAPSHPPCFPSLPPPPSAGILAGVKKGMLARAGASIRMQPGCLDLLRRATEAGIPTCARCACCACCACCARCALGGGKMQVVKAWCVSAALILWCQAGESAWRAFSTLQAFLLSPHLSCHTRTNSAPHPPPTQHTHVVPPPLSLPSPSPLKTTSTTFMQLRCVGQLVGGDGAGGAGAARPVGGRSG
jgi:hypothetical protein